MFALHMARAFATAAATLAASFIFLKCNFKFDESFLRVVSGDTKPKCLVSPGRLS